jgi:hypothetical protein
LLQYADLRVGQLVVIVGIGDHFEIWNSAAYAEMQRRCEEALLAPQPAPPRGPDSLPREVDNLREKPVQDKFF